ncbi:MAG: hypothetical protein H6730_07200 [Deltaproteobacteria bacterium]|nr:hypothetical protein [Deltaproteobacteria bacterium]
MKTTALGLVGALAIAFASGASAQVPTATTAAQGAPAATSAGKEDGPELLLEGLELDEPEPSHTATVAQAAKADDREDYKERTDNMKNAVDRAASIIDRTVLGGYGEHEFEAGPGRVSHFRAHRYVLFVYSQVTDRISVATEIEFEFAGSPNKQDGVLGIGEVLLEFSVVDFEIFEWLVARAGVILMPVGAFNLRHDAPTRDLTARPIAYETIVPSTWFESGAGFYGTIPIGDHQRINYELYVVNGLDSRIYDGFGMRAARGSHFEDNNHDKAVVGRVAYSPLLGLELALSGYTGAYDKAHNRVNMANLDFTWRSGKLELLGEAVFARIDEGFVEGFSASSTANTRDAVPENMFGFYLQANYHFMLPGLRDHLPVWLSDATFTGVVRYEGKDTDLQRQSVQGDQRRLTFGLNFRPIEAYVLKTDFQLNSFGVDEVRSAPDLWQGAFWSDAQFTFMSSVAFLF